jgi:hypothetical protein
LNIAAFLYLSELGLCNSSYCYRNVIKTFLNYVLFCLTPCIIHKNRRKKSSTNTILAELLGKPHVGIADPQWNSNAQIPEIMP